MVEQCGFGIAWVGPCDNEKPCEKHRDLKCDSCGQPATHQCDQTGQFVCGVNLCDWCEHLIFPDGTNGGVGFNAQQLPLGFEKRHVRKCDQKFKVWYLRG